MLLNGLLSAESAQRVGIDTYLWLSACAMVRQTAASQQKSLCPVPCTIPHHGAQHRSTAGSSVLAVFERLGHLIAPWRPNHSDPIPPWT